VEITEKERLMLVKKKEEICKLTNEIMEIEHSPEQITEIKKKMTAILSLISTIASYSNSKNIDLRRFSMATIILFTTMQLHKDAGTWNAVIPLIDTFCNIANSVQYSFTKKGIKIVIPKIDLSIFRKG